MKKLFLVFSCVQILTYTAHADIFRTWVFEEDRVQPFDSVQITDRSGLQLEDFAGNIVSNPVPLTLDDTIVTEIVAIQQPTPLIPIQPIIAGSLTVDFATNSANLNMEERRKIHDFVKQMVDTNVRSIKIAGFADPRGNANYNQMLSGQRARNVAKILENHGISDSMITVEAGGEVSASNLSDSRIVEIVVTR